MQPDYSHVPLVKKLGINQGMSAAFIETPQHYNQLVGILPQPISVDHHLSTNYDFIHFFTRSYKILEDTFPTIKEHLKKTGILWVSWPKSSCNFATADLTDNTVRNVGLTNGLVDVKIAAIDQDWSGIKFVYRIKDRN